MKRNIPLSILLQTEHHNQLYVWCILRGQGIAFHNWTYKTLSAFTGLSHTMLRKRIPELLKLGWLRIEGPHLVLSGVNKLKASATDTAIPISTSRNKKHTILLFRNAIIRNNLTQQRKQISSKNEIVQQCKRSHGKLSKKAMALISKSGGVNSFTSKVQDNSSTTLSNRKIGTLIHRGQSTGKRLQKALNKAGLIKSTTRLKQIAMGVSSLEWAYNYLPTSCGLIYSQNTKTVFKRLSNEITVS